MRYAWVIGLIALLLLSGCGTETALEPSTLGSADDWTECTEIPPPPEHESVEARELEEQFNAIPLPETESRAEAYRDYALRGGSVPRSYKLDNEPPVIDMSSFGVTSDNVWAYADFKENPYVPYFFNLTHDSRKNIVAAWYRKNVSVRLFEEGVTGRFPPTTNWYDEPNMRDVWYEYWEGCWDKQEKYDFPSCYRWCEGRPTETDRWFGDAADREYFLALCRANCGVD